MNQKLSNKGENPEHHHKPMLHVVKTSSMVIAGTIARMLLFFLLQILIIRIISPAQFGLFSLGLAIANILAVLCQLGFTQALPAYISRNLAQGHLSKASGSLIISFRICATIGFLIFIIVFWGADTLAKLQNKPGLGDVLRFFSWTIPFIALTNLFTSQLRGIEHVGGKVYFKDIFQPFCALSLILLVAFFKGNFQWLLTAYASSFLITTVLLFYYTKIRVQKMIPKGNRANVTKELLSFAWPLFGVGIVTQFLMWTDTLILGCLETAESIGLYNGALRFAQLLPLISGAALFVYLPFASRLLAKGDMEGTKKAYSAVTKWVFVITLPVLLITIVCPDFLLGMLLGKSYEETSLVLRILVSGFFFHILFGPNAETIIAYGKSKINLVLITIELFINATIDVALIPKFGIVGAAIATSTSLLLGNCLFFYFAFKLTGLNPFSKKYCKIIAFSVVIIVSMIFFYDTGIIQNPTLIFLVALVISPVVIIICNGLDQNDIIFLTAIEKKLTNQTHLVNKFFK